MTLKCKIAFLRLLIKPYFQRLLKVKIMKKTNLPKSKFLLITGIIVFILGFVLVFTSSFNDINPSKSEIDPRLQKIFSMRDIYNNPLKSLTTDFVIVNFWASWCPPCIEETPSLIRFTQKYAKHFTLIALSQDSSKKEIENFIKTFPALKSADITIVHDDSQNIANSYKVNKLPETFIYSVKENKYFQLSGATDWEQPELIETLNKFFNHHF